MKGATLGNYIEFIDFVKDESGKIIGAKALDTLNNKELNLKCKVAVNCTGLHSDEIRLKDDPNVARRIQGARGTHLMFKKGLLPNDTGIIIPKTKDGRLLFIINYLGHPMVGTTDEKCDVTHFCQPTEKEIEFMFKELEPYFGEDYDYKNNLVSAWAGIRPLVKENSVKSQEEIDDEAMQKAKMGAKDYATSFFANSVRWLAYTADKLRGKGKASATAKLSRTHVIETSQSGLVSLMGGKWTSFRHMGQETVDKILEKNKLDTKYDETQTLNFSLIGSYSRLESLTRVNIVPKQLFNQYEDYLTLKQDLSRDSAQHLVHTYGTSSKRVVDLGQQNRLLGLPGQNEKIHPDYPFLKSEIAYAVKHELAEKPNDIICRRVPIAFLNT